MSRCEYGTEALILDKMISSEKEACFSDEINHLKNKIQIFFWLPRFRWVRNVLRQILSKKTVLDNLYGCGKERPKLEKSLYLHLLWVRSVNRKTFIFHISYLDLFLIFS